MGMSRARQLRIEILEQQLEKLEKDYRAVAQKKLYESNPQQQNNWQLQLENIASQIEETEEQLNQLKQLEQEDKSQTWSNPLPPIEVPISPQPPPQPTFKPEVSTIEPETGTTSPKINLQPFEFEVTSIELKQTGWLQKKIEIELIRKPRQRAYHFKEDLGNGVQLEMVAIPEGSFLMGSPKDEPGWHSSQSPQHRVTVESFLMGKYPVTQAQWRAVAALPQVHRELKPDPSYFKGADRPVECVSWYDAVEFCARLTQKTGWQYRLPSEAEWEYACRAGSTTPFHFGETITTDLANYRGTDWDIGGTVYKGSYGQGSKGIYRKKTTDVGSFKVANDFGLYDMHGNVWEWCADSWHSNYEGAPTDGSVWEDENDNENQSRLLRGGSWLNNPKDCRSAYRDGYAPGVTHVDTFGFRVVCGSAWTL